MSASQAYTDSENGASESNGQNDVDVLQEHAEAASEHVDFDDVFDVLSNRRRRQILWLLDDRDDNTASVPELASVIAAWEKDFDDPDHVTYDDRKSVQASIYQHHAPKMADADLVEYDKRSGTLRLEPDVPTFAGTNETDEPNAWNVSNRVRLATVAAVAATTVVVLVYYAFPNAAPLVFAVVLPIVGFAAFIRLSTRRRSTN